MKIRVEAKSAYETFSPKEQLPADRRTLTDEFIRPLPKVFVTNGRTEILTGCIGALDAPGPISHESQTFGEHKEGNESKRI